MLPRRSPLAAWQSLVARGVLAHDEAQVPVVRAFDRLYARVTAAEERRQPRGLYVYGGVGTGKSCLADLFYECVSARLRCRRLHFHELLREVHARRPAAALGAALATEAPVLCVDEFQLTDLADGLLLRRLFETYWRGGGVVVATSNRPPDDLYERGANRRFLEPFFADLRKFCLVRRIRSDRDHRREKGAPREEAVSRTPPRTLRSWAESAIVRSSDESQRSSSSRNSEQLTWTEGAAVRVGARRVRVPLVAASAQQTWACFAFADLCRAELGAADYAALAGAYGRVALFDVPVLTRKDHDAARRFITLVDCLYEARARLLLDARAPPDRLLLPADDLADHDLVSVRELAWAFRRAASRLTEMAAPTWPDHTLRRPSSSSSASSSPLLQ